MDPGSSSYAAAVDGTDALARPVAARYPRRGGGHVRQVAAIGGGAAWIWATAGTPDPHATRSAGIWPAWQHRAGLAARLAVITPGPDQRLAGRSDEPAAGNIAAITRAARACPLARGGSAGPAAESACLTDGCGTVTTLPGTVSHPSAGAEVWAGSL